IEFQGLVKVLEGRSVPLEFGVGPAALGVGGRIVLVPLEGLVKVGNGLLKLLPLEVCLAPVKIVGGLLRVEAHGFVKGGDGRAPIPRPGSAVRLARASPEVAPVSAPAGASACLPRVSPSAPTAGRAEAGRAIQPARTLPAAPSLPARPR